MHILFYQSSPFIYSLDYILPKLALAMLQWFINLCNQHKKYTEIFLGHLPWKKAKMKKLHKNIKKYNIHALGRDYKHSKMINIAHKHV